MHIDIKAFDELTNKELYALLKLRVDVFVVEQNCAYQELDNEDQEAIHVLMKSNHDELIGYSRILFKNETIHIGRIVTSKEHRGKGLGKQLMNHCIEYARKNHPSKVVEIAAQIQLESYYKQFGFQTVSAPYDWDGILHVDMELKNHST